jgi:peptide/nickel transport system substrate-binding protein
MPAEGPRGAKLNSRWLTIVGIGEDGVAGLGEEAKRLIAEAKSEGWDGKIRVLGTNTPEGVAWALAVQAQLAAAGMEVAVDTSKDTSGMVVQVRTQKDYDIVTFGYGLLDESDGNYLLLTAEFGNKLDGYGPPDMLSAIDKLRIATNDAERTAAYKAISEIWVRDVPAHVTTTIVQTYVHTPKLHNATRTANHSIILSRAWLEK